MMMSRLTAALRALAVPAALCAAAFAPITARAQTPAPLAAKPAATQSESLLLRWIKPSVFVQQLMPTSDDGNRTLLVPGLLRVSTDDAKGRVLMQGSEKALMQVREIVPLLDVEPKSVFLSARLLRVPASTDVPTNLGADAPRLRGIVVTTATAKTTNNQSVLLCAIGDGNLFHVKLTPHINGDNSITVSMEVGNSSPSAPSMKLDGGIIKGEAKGAGETRRTANGTPTLAARQPVLGLSNTKYYWEITPIVSPRVPDVQTETTHAAPKTPIQIAKRK